MSEFRDIFGGAFNPDDHPEDNDYKPIPAGKYPVIVEEVAIEPTKAEDGHFLKVQFCVTGESYRNRKLFDRFNIDNPSEKCMNIAKMQLGKLCRVLGITSFDDEAQLLDGAVIAHVKVDGEYNAITDYSAIGDPQSVVHKVDVDDGLNVVGSDRRRQDSTKTEDGPPPWERPQE